MAQRQSTPADILSGRRERDLLALPSVRRMADLLSQRCREPSWVRMTVAALERFRALTDQRDLEALIEDGRRDPMVAERAMGRLADGLSDRTESQVAALAMGPKIWFRLNGVPVSWRPLPGRASAPPLPVETDGDLASAAVLLSLIGSGLHRAELFRLRVGSIGSLDADARLIPDVEAEPMAIVHTPLRGKQVERLTFLTFQARQALLLYLARRAGAGERLHPGAPLIVQADGARSARAGVNRAVQLSTSLINTVSDVNLELCMTTGNFFRTWGAPGSRFAGSEEFNMEDFE